MKRIVCLLFVILPFTAVADGLPLKDGRYPGKVVTFQMTARQKAVAARFRTCHLARYQVMNVYTPYVFRLTPEQARTVRRAIGFSPSRFDLYETYRGFNDAGPHWNLALRYSEDRIEIPLDLLRKDQDAAAEEREQGWNPVNPCFPRSGQGTPSRSHSAAR